MMVPTLFGIILIVFTLLNFIPGASQNPFRTYGYDDELETFFQTHNVPENYASKYVRYCYSVFVKHDFNPHGRRSMDLNQTLPIRVWLTLKLTAYGIIAALLIGVPLGMVSALYHGKLPDKIISSVSLLFSSIPSYCLAIFLIIIFALGLRILPISGTMQPGSYIMPTAVLAVGGVSLVLRMTRSAVKDVLNQPYITALRAKGLSYKRVLWVHILKNSLILIVATMNNVIVQMLCSTLIVENLFSIPGLGAFLVNMVLGRSLHGVLGCVILIAVILMAANLLSDGLCLAVDAKLRQKHTRKKG